MFLRVRFSEVTQLATGPSAVVAEHETKETTERKKQACSFDRGKAKPEEHNVPKSSRNFATMRSFSIATVLGGMSADFGHYFSGKCAWTPADRRTGA